MTSLVNVTNDYIAGAHRFYTIGSGTSNDNLTNFSIQPKYETVRIQDSNVFITGSIYPTSCNVYDIGSSNYRWRDLYLSGNTIDLGGTRISRNNATGGMKISSKVNDTPLDFTAQHITALGTLYASNITIAGNALMIEDNGNVGMGTAIPTQKLDVRGNIYASGNIVCSNISVIGDFVRLDTITSNTEQMVISNNGTGPALKVTQTGANSVAEFYDSESGVALFVGNGGNIGIGTTKPQQLLDVNGNALIRGNIGIGTNIPQQLLDVNGNAIIRGNIGIGTSLPSTALHIIGNMLINGYIYPKYKVHDNIVYDPSICDGTTSQRAGISALQLYLDGYSTISGLRWLKCDGFTVQQIYCDFDTPNGPWTVPIYNKDADDISTLVRFKAFYITRGIPNAGRCAGSTKDAWMSVKRTITLINDPSYAYVGTRGGGPLLTMPFYRTQTTVSAYVHDWIEVCSANILRELPPNVLGDAMSGGGTEQYGGWWNDSPTAWVNSWRDGNYNNYPDPEDWAWTNYMTPSQNGIPYRICGIFK